MIEKRDVIRYLLIIGILMVLFGILMVLKSGMTGFAVYEDSIQGDFDSGTYDNTEWNGSVVVLVGSNLTGNYTSQIFDAVGDSVWNNMSWVSNEPDLESLF